MKGLVKIHFNTYGEVPLEEHVQISGRHKGEKLLTLETVYIHELKQTINSKDEYRSRTPLTLKFPTFTWFIHLFSFCILG